MSNLGTVRFCKQKQLSQTTFYRWKSKFDAETKKEYVKQKENSRWVEAVVPLKQPIPGNAEIFVKVGDFTISIPNDFEESTFLRVCKALVSLC